MDEKRVVNIEKRAVNKPGLIILILLVLAGLIFGGYYFYNNRDYYSFSFSFPWEKKPTTNKAGEKIDKKTGFRLPKVDDIARGEINVSKQDGKSDSSFSIYGVTISIESVLYNKDNDSYTINFSFYNETDDIAKLEANNINLDKYQTGLKLEIISGPNSTANGSLVIPKEVLDLYRIGTFTDVVLHSNITSQGEVHSETIELPVEAASSEDSIRPIEKISEYRDVSFSYYKVEEEKDRYYLYIIVDNNSLFDITYYTNKFLINDKEYKGTIDGKKVYSKSIMLDKIEILKKDHRNIKTIDMSFFIRSGANTIYQTKEKEVQL